MGPGAVGQEPPRAEAAGRVSKRTCAARFASKSETSLAHLDAAQFLLMRVDQTRSGIGGIAYGGQLPA